MLKIALAAENSILLDGVKAGFEEYFFLKEIIVNFFKTNSSKRRESVEGEIFRDAERKMKNLRKNVKEEYDYFIVLEDGLFSKGGNFFYSQVATIEAVNLRGAKMQGISSGLLVPENMVLKVLNNGFTEVLSDADLMVMTKMSFSMNILAKQATLMALSACNW